MSEPNTPSPSMDHQSATEPLSWTGERFSRSAYRFKTILAFLLLLLAACGAKFCAFPCAEKTCCHWCAWLIVPILLLLYVRLRAWYKYLSIRYELKDMAIYCHRGLLNRRVDTFLCIQILKLEKRQNYIDKIVNGGVGTIEIKGTDVSDPVLNLEGLAHPDEAFDTLTTIHRKIASRRGFVSFGASGTDDMGDDGGF